MDLINSSTPDSSNTNNTSTVQENMGSLGFYGTDEYSAIIVALLTVVIVFGVLGNLAVIGTLFQRQRNLKTSSNYLIINIAVSDLLVAVIIAPLRFVEMYHGWPLGNFLCHFLAPLQDVIVCVSVVTHTFIALERYRGIVQPFKEKLTIQRTKQVIGIIWLTCYIASGLPVAFVVKESVEHGHQVCNVSWPSDLSRQLFILYLVIIFVFIPLVIQTYAYSQIVKVVNLEITSVRKDEFVEIRAVKLAQSRARVLKTLILLVCAFYICSIPRVFTMLLWEFGGGLKENLDFHYAITITLIVYYLKHVINPIIIFGTSAEFRYNCGYMCCPPSE